MCSRPGLVLSLAEAKGSIARELLNADYTGTQDAHLKKGGELINQGMTVGDFECLQFTLEKLRAGKDRIKAAGTAVTGKKLGILSLTRLDFSYSKMLAGAASGTRRCIGACRLWDCRRRADGIRWQANSHTSVQYVASASRFRSTTFSPITPTGAEPWTIHLHQSLQASTIWDTPHTTAYSPCI